MGDISEHFSRYEFACKCGCGLDTVDVETVKVVQSLRNNFGRRVTILSGCRCANHNAKVGGEKQSLHMACRAADVSVEGVAPRAVADYLEKTYPHRYGIGRYPTFTHIDTRTKGPARWGAN